ncbi:hypothetical protein PHJA_002053100 [Phtheirospermum japonicum]|uniref:SWIM-type domain-containing protein n=1 Tax=Phtheirospermum japonicum TaxID=374723 RepID=A0A830CLF1_9LAMI|nr:hypothetical protein PHJA_002053100 [Phtheirospermum japonicum]
MHMAKGKLILICQSGGEFLTKDDNTLSYEGGEANAVNINHETMFDNLKLKLAEVSNLDQKTISVKYFLPGNRRNLITLRNDKDLKRMIDFHENSVTADIFVDGKVGFDHDAVKVHTSGDGGLKLAETVDHISGDATLVAANNLKNLADTILDSSSPSLTYSASPASSEHDDFEYKPRLSINVNNADQSPADTVKKRRRTASWAIGTHGPTIVAVSDTNNNNNDGNTRRRKKNTPRRSSLSIADDTLSDSDGLPEKLLVTWRDCISGVGQDFSSVKEFREVLQKYAIAHRFAYKLKKNDSNRASGVCVDEGCSWSIHASWVPAAHSFRIKKFNNSHTCGGESWKNAHPARKLLVSVIKDKLRDSPHHKPKEIAKSISRDFGIELKYTQVRRGIEGAREQLQGSYKDSYNSLPCLCEKLVEANPGSLIKLLTDDDKRFQSLFVSFVSCIQSFQNGCRPILFLDSTSLRSKYQESLLTATAVDADDGFFPIAFGIVDAENDASWRWFLDQLKSAMSLSSPLTFVSDMDKGLKEHVDQIFENVHHGYSMYHLIESFKRNLRGPFHGDGRGVLPGKFLAAAHAVRLSAFKKLTEQIKQISPNAYDWLDRIEPEHWTRLSFKGEQYNYIVQNVAEQYIKLMDEIRESTITQKVEAVVHMMSEVMNSRRARSSEWTTTLAPSKAKRVEEEGAKSCGLRVFISSDVLFEVHDDATHVVDIEKRECTCLEWKGSGIPCRHAIAALNCSGRSVYDFCSRYFTVESYRLTYSSSVVNAIVTSSGKDDDDDDDDGDESGEVKVYPPKEQKRKKEEKVKTEDPDKRTVTCSRCKEPGHNKASCKATLGFELNPLIHRHHLAARLSLKTPPPPPSLLPSATTRRVSILIDHAAHLLVGLSFSKNPSNPTIAYLI